MPAPTVNRQPVRTAGVSPQGSAATTPAIPFTRAARKRTIAFSVPTALLTTATQTLAPTQLPPAGYLRYLELQFTATTSANAAAVTFNADAPFNLIQQISLTSANGDALIQPIDGFTLYLLNKYGGYSFGLWQPQADPGFLATTGAGSTGGSFNFTLYVPVERDSRDAFCALENMAANQSYALGLIYNPAASIYGVSPTTLPSVVVTATMHYWSAPAATSAGGDLQQVSPAGLGSVGLIQIQTPPLVAGSLQDIQQILVGNTIRFILYTLRTAGGVRDSADWPGQVNWIVNNDTWYVKFKAAWLAQLQNAYDFFNPVSATAIGAVNALDQGVFPFIDFINDGGQGAQRVDATSNRDLYLVTGSATGIEFEARTWGGSAGSLQITQDTLRPASPQALYNPYFK